MENPGGPGIRICHKALLTWRWPLVLGQVLPPINPAHCHSVVHSLVSLCLPVAKAPALSLGVTCFPCPGAEGISRWDTPADLTSGDAVLLAAPAVVPTGLSVGTQVH